MNNTLLKIKTLAELDFDIAKKNTHVLDDTAYWKLHTQIPFDNLFWLIKRAEQTQRYEKAIRKSILIADELYSEHRDADNVVEDIFQELKKALNE